MIWTFPHRRICVSVNKRGNKSLIAYILLPIKQKEEEETRCVTAQLACGSHLNKGEFSQNWFCFVVIIFCYDWYDSHILLYYYWRHTVASETTDKKLMSLQKSLTLITDSQTIITVSQNDVVDISNVNSGSAELAVICYNGLSYTFPSLANRADHVTSAIC